MTHAIRCVVVEIPLAQAGVQTLPQDDILAIRFVDLADHLPVLPDLVLVVAPLYRPRFDAMELIDLLGERGFRGTFRVVAPRLPNRGGVLRELRGHAVRRGITVELIDAD